MDWAVDRELCIERCATELGPADRGRTFGCVTPLCAAEMVPVAIPHSGNPRPKRPVHYRTRPGSEHAPICMLPDEPDRTLEGSTPASAPDGPPTVAPGRIVFDRKGVTDSEARDPGADATTRSRSLQRADDTGLRDHIRSSRTIRPACEYLLRHPNDLDRPLELPHLGAVTYAEAFAPIPASSYRNRGWRIWRASVPFKQTPSLVGSRLRIETFAGWSDRRFVTVDCSGWTGGLEERLEMRLRESLAASRRSWRVGGRLSCQLFAFAPESTERDDIVVSHPAMLCLLLAEPRQANTSARRDQRASSLETR